MKCRQKGPKDVLQTVSGALFFESLSCLNCTSQVNVSGYNVSVQNIYFSWIDKLSRHASMDMLLDDV